MKSEEFRLLLQAAVSGNHEALEKLFLLYTPLINKYSSVDGRLDEDLRQYLLIHIALNCNLRWTVAVDAVVSSRRAA